MKMLKIKQTQPFGLIIVLLAVSMSLISANMVRNDQAPKMPKEVRRYFKEKVFPVVSQARQEFDKNLTEEEKQKIEEVRASLHEKREKKRDAGEMKEHGRKGHHRRIANKEVAGELLDILNGHREELAEAQDYIAQYVPVWKEEVNRLLTSEEEMNHKKDKRFRELTKPLNFLLMPPHPPKEAHFDQREESSSYPNPVVNQGTVQLTLEKDERVMIQILDINGHLIKTVMDEQKSAGDHTTVVDNSDLKDGIYYYAIITPTKHDMLRFIKQ